MTPHALPLLRRLRRGRHARSAVLLAGCLSLVVALLLTAVTAAVRLGGLAGLGGLVGAGSLDYARGPLGEYFPLTDSFVEDSLGRAFVRAPGAVGQVGPGLGSGSAAGTSSTASGSGSGIGSGDDVPPPDEIGNDLGNDDFAKAYAIRGLPFTSRTTALSTREPGEPAPCGPPTGGSRWFQYTPRTDAGLLATTWGTELGSAISVYTGPSMSELTLIDCGGGPSGGGQVPFAATAGTKYWFQAVKTVGDAALVFSLNVQGTTTLASVDSDGRPGTSDSDQPQTSADGRFVVFVSTADLVPGTQNGCVSTPHPDAGGLFARAPGPCQNVYVRDLLRKKTTLVSTPDDVVGGDDDSWEPSISSDGRYVAFASWAANLVPGDTDTNETIDVFLRDLVAHSTRRVSLTSTGRQTTDPMQAPSYTAVSDDGRFVAFSSAAPELSADDCDSVCRLGYIRDVRTGRTQLVSVDKAGDPYDDVSIAGLSSDGRRVAFNTNHTASPGSQSQVVVSDWQSPGRSFVASRPDSGDEDPTGASICLVPRCLTADGRLLVFVSWADNLVPGDTNGAYDFFVRDLVAGSTRMVSLSSTGELSHPSPADPVTLSSTNASPGYPSVTIDPDGRFVVFSSDAPDLVPGDSNRTYDVFVRDLRRGTTTRASVHTNGTQSNGISYRGVPSRGGRSITFVGRGFDEDGTGTFSVYVRQLGAS